MTDVPPVTAVADVLALWGHDGWLTPPLTARVAADAPRLGRARTVHLASGATGTGLADVYELLSSGLDGDVLVIGASDAPGAVWGEILATAATGAGAAGVLVHGAVRDVSAMRSVALPTYSAAVAVVGPNGGAYVQHVGQSLPIGDTTVAEEDVIVMDGEGCVRIPAAIATDVLDAARQYAEAEEQVLDALRSGTPMRDAYVHKRETLDRLRDTRR